MIYSNFTQQVKEKAPSVYAGFLKIRIPKLENRLLDLRRQYKYATIEEQKRIMLEAEDIKRELSFYTEKESSKS